VTVGPHGPQIELTGRDFGGLLEDESAPYINLTNRTLSNILSLLVAPFSDRITKIITDNRANRYAVSGVKITKAQLRRLEQQKKTPRSQKKYQDAVRSYKAARPVYAPYSQDRFFESTVQPGEKIWELIDRLAKHIGMSAWMTADGELCMGRPDYKQPPVAALYHYLDDAGNSIDSNCLITRSPDIGDRYSDYVSLGQGRTMATAEGAAVSDHHYTAQDPSRSFWYDAQVRRLQKRDVRVVRNTSHRKHLRRFARTEMELRAVRSYNMIATVTGHRAFPGGPLWACDTTVDVEYDPKEINAPHYIRRRGFNHDKGSGKSTDMTLIPIDIWLAHDHDYVSDLAYFNATRKVFDRYAL
jgi:prophage tail gpP-like protein